MVEDKDLIQLENVEYAYKMQDSQPHAALHGVSLTIRRGEFVAVVGHNGSGKSTLAKHLNVILTPDQGRVVVWGMDTSDEARLYEIRRSAGMVFQNPDNQIVATVVEEDVAFAPENLGVPPAEIRLRVDSALRTVGMLKYRQHATYQLSGGQKQRVAIAGILAMQPDCIILDEPTAMLDPVGRREILATVHKLNEEMGITVILITHHMNEAAAAGRIIVMAEGRVIMDAPPREIFADTEVLERAGLIVPQPVELLQRLRAAGIEVNTNVLTAEECAKALYALIQKKQEV
jgi:energy-coupling factor transport system ATP-binding protein